MNIVIVGTAHPFRGGLAAYNERLARQFASEGHEVSINTFTVQYPAFLFPGKTQYIDAPAPDDLPIRRSVNSVNPFNWIINGLKLRKSRPDILIFKYWLPFMAPCFGTIARIARWNRHTRVICIFDNVIPHEKRPGDKLLTSYFIRAIDGAVAMSQSVLDDLRKFNPLVPSALNPHPLFDNFGKGMDRNTAKDQLGIDKSLKIVLFFGFIRAYKGLDLLIEAFADERLKDKHLALLIAGEFYEDDKPYKEQIARPGIEKNVILFDRFINDNEVQVFFSAADLVVQPYRSATQSGVTQICYHFEKPMVVTDVGGLKEIVPDGKCGYVVKPDPAEIAGAISDFFENNREEFFSGNIRNEKARFGWDRMSRSVTDIYKKCLADDNKK